MLTRISARLVGFALLAVLVAAPALAHPEDEFCTPGDGGLDPALCRELNALQSADGGGAIAAAVNLERAPLETLAVYVGVGARHILPGGLDHVLFVLALFFSARNLRDLVLQISAFTVAHTATLGLAAAGVIAPPASIVEPLIAASIAAVALETVFLDGQPRWRLAMVFAFGLLHGLGFAGVFGELGLPADQFWSGLVGFNIGVEVGQLSVIAVAGALACLLRRAVPPLRRPAGWKRVAAVPASLAIAAIGAFWTVERLLGA